MSMTNTSPLSIPTRAQKVMQYNNFADLCSTKYKSIILGVKTDHKKFEKKKKNNNNNNNNNNNKTTSNKNICMCNIEHVAQSIRG
jgi:hypothetical protein